MGIAIQPFPSVTSNPSGTHRQIHFSGKPTSFDPMSRDYQQSIFSFSDGFERLPHEQQQRIAQQIRRGKLRVDGLIEPPLPLMEVVEESSSLTGYEAAGMLSEMFTFQPDAGATSATELLERQMPATGSNNWYGERDGTIAVMGGGGSKDQNIGGDRDSATAHQHQVPRINGDAAAANSMHFFLMNPQPPRSPSPSPSHLSSTSTSLQRLLPNHSSSTSNFQGFHSTVGTASPAEGVFGPSQFTWVPGSSHEEMVLSTVSHLNNPSEIEGIINGQGLSLSLSSSLQELEAAKAHQELRMGEGGLFLFNQGDGHTVSSPQYQYRNLLHGGLGQSHQFHVGFGNNNSSGVVNTLRNSKYAKATQELLQEFCSVTRSAQFKNESGRISNTNPNSSNPNGSVGGAVDGRNSSSSSKDNPPLSASYKIEHQRRKVKLLSMLDEVDRRYNHYCDQMQMVVNSYDSVMGLGAAVPYTALARKAMSRHFRCIKDAIGAQLRQSCELLGEKDASSGGVTKGETPRLRLLEQRLRQHKAFVGHHHLGLNMTDQQDAWRPQRGLPERSVNTLRAWLFEHFLHPYPSEADKHLLSRQTGLSRGQVSNWFINARVRLWKPMIEEMYEQEIKDNDGGETEMDQNSEGSPNPVAGNINASATAAITESDPSVAAINGQQQQQRRQPEVQSQRQTATAAIDRPLSVLHDGSASTADMSTRFIHFGAISGDVSLTLGLRHAGNLPDNSPFFS